MNSRERCAPIGKRRLVRTFSLNRIRGVLAATSEASQRPRDLPAHVAAYYVVALADARSGLKANWDPDELSFLHAVRVVRRRIAR